jgi:hypothetical protein
MSHAESRHDTGCKIYKYYTLRAIHMGRPICMYVSKRDERAGLHIL